MTVGEKIDSIVEDITKSSFVAGHIAEQVLLKVFEQDPTAVIQVNGKHIYYSNTTQYKQDLAILDRTR